MKFLLGWFGYAKVPHETVKLAEWVRDRAIVSNADPAVVDGIRTLHRWLVSARGLQ